MKYKVLYQRTTTPWAVNNPDDKGSEQPLGLDDNQSPDAWDTFQRSSAALEQPAGNVSATQMAGLRNCV